MRILWILAAILAVVCMNIGCEKPHCEQHAQCEPGFYCDQEGFCSQQCHATKPCPEGLVCTILGDCGEQLKPYPSTITPEDVPYYTEAGQGWVLQADEQLVLKDRELVRPGYANPVECQEMALHLGESGGLVGACWQGDFLLEINGGPAQGIPYTTIPFVSQRRLLVAVMDLHGKVSRVYTGLKDFCIEVDANCTMCADEFGIAEHTGCPTYSGSGVGIPSAQSNGAGNERRNESCFQRGVHQFIDGVDDELYTMRLPLSQLSAEKVTQQDPNRYATIATSLCQPNAWLPDSDQGFMNGDILRCGALGHYVSVTSCDSTPDDCQETAGDYITGISAALAGWQFATRQVIPGQEEGATTINERLPPCRGDPLVVVAPGQDLVLSSVSLGVGFDLLAIGARVQTGWLKQGRFLALDLDGSGQIEHGGELFSEVTELHSGGRAVDGFAALAQYDRVQLGGNEDGHISDRDAVFSQLLLWEDSDSDGVSRPKELVPASMAGLETVLLRPQKVDACLANSAGHVIELYSGVGWTDGSWSKCYDIWFTHEGPALARR